MLCKYDNIIKDQHKKGIIERVNEKIKEGERKHYIPHHAVFTPAKDTTKVRIVYDASAKTGNTNLNWMNVQGTSYSWRSLWIVVEISNEKNWNHCWYWESIFTDSPSTERKRCYQILMVKGYKTTSITQQPSYLLIHKNTLWNHIEPFLARCDNQASPET